jgi:hypothetical protein
MRQPRQPPPHTSRILSISALLKSGFSMIGTCAFGRTGDHPSNHPNFPGELFLLRSAGCAAGAAAVLLPLREAAAKMSQASVQYQSTPKDNQQCSNCSLFQEPDACTIIDGEVSPQGWCRFWAKKPS